MTFVGHHTSVHTTSQALVKVAIEGYKIPDRISDKLLTRHFAVYVSKGQSNYPIVYITNCTLLLLTRDLKPS